MLWNGNNHLNEIRLLSRDSGRAETKKFKTIVSQNGYTELNTAIQIITVFRKTRSLFKWSIIVYILFKS
jgi:hypothetical protein